jgi:hypothetical protein
MKGRNRKVVTIILAIGLLIIMVGVAGVVISSSSATPTPIVTPTAVATPVPDGEDGFVYNGMTYFGDYDLDYDGVSDKLEVKVYGTNPMNKDTDGDGIDDYNELFIYPDYLDPLNSSDAQLFIDMLPNVTANYTDWVNGGTSGNNLGRIVNASLNDPLVKWVAEHTSIAWEGMSGWLTIDGEPFFQGYALNVVPIGALMTPAYYLTHGRTGACGDTAEAIYVTMKLKGFQCVLIYGTVGDELHGWVEAKMGDTIYVINYNSVVPADDFYLAHPDWAIEKRYTEENPYTNISW